jgi:hypothetical protein
MDFMLVLIFPFSFFCPLGLQFVKPLCRGLQLSGLEIKKLFGTSSKTASEI